MSRPRRVALALSLFVVSMLLLAPLLSGRARAAGALMLDEMFEDY